MEEILKEAKRIEELVSSMTEDVSKGAIAMMYFINGTEFAQKWTPISDGLPIRCRLVNVKIKQDPEKRTVFIKGTAWFDYDNGRQLWHIYGTDEYLSEPPTHWKYLK